MEPPLDRVLGGGVHPARLDEVDPDAVAQQRERRVLRHGDQGLLRGGVGIQLRCTTGGGDRTDVGDRAGHTGPGHEVGGQRRDPAGGPHVGDQHGVPHLLGRVPDRAPHGQRRGIHRGVHRAERLLDGGHDPVGCAGDRQVLGDGQHAGRRGREFGRRGLGLRRVPTDDGHTGRTLGDEALGDGAPGALAAPGDEGEATFERPGHVSRVRSRRRTPRRPTPSSSRGRPERTRRRAPR